MMGHTWEEGSLENRPGGWCSLAAAVVMACTVAAPVLGAIPASERAALVALYQATRGDGWTDRSNWRTPDGSDFNAPGTECTWYGVACDAGETTVLLLDLSYNNLDGTLPPELGALGNLYSLLVPGNHLSGPVPPELGALANLQYLYLASNLLSGELPPELAGLTNLRTGGVDLRYNALHTTDETLAAFLDSKQLGGDWRSTQTIAPEGTTLTAPTPCTAVLSWTAVSYTADPGGYIVFMAPSASGPWQDLGMIPSKATTSVELPLTDPDTAYWFRVSTYTDPHASNDNVVISDPGEAVSITTVSAPVITSAGDFSACERSGIRVFYTATPGAEAHDLIRDGSVVAAGYASGQLHDPGDAAPHDYRIGVQGCGSGWRSAPVTVADLEAAAPGFAGLTSAQDVTPYMASGIRLLWDEPADWGDNGDSIGREFRVYRDGVQIATTTPGVTSFLDDTVEVGVTAGYRVEAVNGCGLASDGGVVLEARDLWGVNDLERQGLIALYQSTGGDGWTDRSNWRTADGSDFNVPGTECDWYGVVCAALPDGSRTVNAIELAHNGLSGVLPEEIVWLSNIQTLNVAANAITGPLPSPISAQGLGMLRTLNLSGNLLRGEPDLDGVLGELDEGGLDIRWNALSTTDPHLAALLDAKQAGGDWRSTQTVPPQDVTAGDSSACSVKLSWTPVTYTADPGGYLIEQAPSQDGPWEQVLEVTDKNRISARVWGLQPGVPVWFRVRSYTEPHYENPNRMVSDPGAVVDAVPSGQPTITKVQDLSGCTVSGIAVQFQPGPAAVRHDLLVDGTVAVTGYTSGQTYAPGDTNRHFYSVRAVDAVGCTADSDPAEGWDLAGKPPVFEGIATAEDLDPVEDTGVAVGWALPSDWRDGGEGSGRAFHVYRDGTLAGTVGQTVTSFIDTGGTNNTTHTYRVEAVNGCSLTEDGGVALTAEDTVGLSMDERQVLEAVYQACGGDGWQDRTNWRTPDGSDFNERGTECTWFGVTCSEGTEVHVTALDLGANGLTGSIPEALAGLAALQELDLSGNALEGPIPAGLGNLADLQTLDLASNRLQGEIPTELQGLAALAAGGLDLRWNALHTGDAGLAAFLDQHQVGGDWSSTQTVAPANPAAGDGSRCAIIVSWDPVAYTADPGGYTVEIAPGASGPWQEAAVEIPDKTASAVAVTGLDPLTTYWFRVRSYTDPHAHNANLVSSEAGEAVAATTGSGGTAADADVNGDGLVDAGDIRDVLDYLFVPAAVLRPDVTCDGTVGADDLAALIESAW